MIPALKTLNNLMIPALKTLNYLIISALKTWFNDSCIKTLNNVMIPALETLNNWMIPVPLNVLRVIIVIWLNYTEKIPIFQKYWLQQILYIWFLVFYA